MHVTHREATNHKEASWKYSRYKFTTHYSRFSTRRVMKKGLKEEYGNLIVPKCVILPAPKHVIAAGV